MELEKPETVEDLKDVDPKVKRRLDTLHMHGTDKMSNNDIFSYFSEYSATFLEWINDSSCNVLFADNFTALRALIGESKPIVLKNIKIAEPTNNKDETAKTEKEEEEELDIVDEPEQLETKTALSALASNTTKPNESISKGGDPIEFTWRKGKDWKGQTILLRFATIEDIRPTKPKRSQKLWLKKNQKEQNDLRGTKRKSAIIPVVLSAKEEEKRKMRRTKFGYVGTSSKEEEEEEDEKREEVKEAILQGDLKVTEEEINVDEEEDKENITEVVSQKEKIKENTNQPKVE